MEEQLAFSDWINTNLGEDLHLTHILPLADSGLSLYDAVKDGILLCKIVNHSCPDTVDERVINIVLGLLWQIIRVSLERCPGLANLLEGGEQLAFSDWINTNLGEDLHLTHILPLADSVSC